LFPFLSTKFSLQDPHAKIAVGDFAHGEEKGDQK